MMILMIMMIVRMIIPLMTGRAAGGGPVTVVMSIGCSPGDSCTGAGGR